MAVPDFNTSKLINAPSGATHFQLVLGVVVISDYVFAQTEKEYEPVNPAVNGLHGVEKSAEIPLNGNVGSPTVLKAQLTGTSSVPTNAGVLVCTGVLFLQEVNGQFYLLEERNALLIEKVF